MYSARASDEMALNLQCRTPGTITATIVRSSPGATAPANWPFSLASGAERTDLTGSITTPSSEVWIIEAELPVSAPVLAALRSTGQLSLQDATQTSPVQLNAINAAERGEIERFVLACPPS
jgi:hypothetical protein